MKSKKIAIAMLCAVTTTGLVATPFVTLAEQQPTPLADKPDKVEPFKGKVEAVDAAGNTLTVEGKVYQITASTKLTKTGKTITLAEIAVNDRVHGLAKSTEDGKNEATTVMVLPPES